MAVTSLFQKTTPVLIVERIEPVIPFWKLLGLELATQVHDPAATDGRLVFVILATEGIEIMYQTVASVREDLLKSASDKAAFRPDPQQTTLYVEVSQLTEIEGKLRGERVIMPRRTTFYGSTEIGYADPAGNIVVFAELERRANG